MHAALGFLELTLGRADEAVAQLAPIERLLEGSGLEDQTTVPWAADLIEAHVRSGAEDDARRVLATLERQAGATGSAFAGAAAARCRGMLDEPFDAAFAAALACDDRRPMPFERARTLLAHGRRLHRAKRRADARERLREAQAGFERLGAAAWAAQAQSELRAAGGRRRRAPHRAHAAGAARRGRRAQRRDQPRDRRAAVPLAADDRVPPDPDLPQARDPLADPARRGAGAP